MTHTFVAPIACTLTGDGLRDRASVIAHLNARALLRHERRDLRLLLVYRADAIPALRTILQLESECCAFLSFTLDESVGTEAQLHIVAPESARDAVDSIFALFIPSPAASAASPDQVLDRAPARPAESKIIATGAVAALACGACCMLSFVAPAVALTGLGSVAAFVARSYWWAISLAVLGVIAAWRWLPWRGARARPQ